MVLFLEYIKCIIVPRKNENSGEIISASNVRKLIKEENFDITKETVPESTYKYLISQECKTNNRKYKTNWGFSSLLIILSNFFRPI